MCEASQKIKSVCGRGMGMCNGRVSEVLIIVIKKGMSPVLLREFGAPPCWLLKKVSLESL